MKNWNGCLFVLTSPILLRWHKTEIGSVTKSSWRLFNKGPEDQVLNLFSEKLSSYLDTEVVGADSDQAGVDQTAIGGGHSVGGGVGEGKDLVREHVCINLRRSNI